jgi:hypothetical protein
MNRCTPYAPRATTFAGLLQQGGWRLRHWKIVYGERPIDAARFEGGRHLALAALPEPAVAPDRPGVGLLIEHQGNGADYVVLGWWDRENELPLRVFVRDGAAWRPAQGSESVCVWDLEVIARERDTYVRCLLGPTGPDVEAYLADVIHQSAPSPGGRSGPTSHG